MKIIFKVCDEYINRYFNGTTNRLLKVKKDHASKLEKLILISAVPIAILIYGGLSTIVVIAVYPTIETRLTFVQAMLMSVIGILGMISVLKKMKNKLVRKIISFSWGIAVILGFSIIKTIYNIHTELGLIPSYPILEKMNLIYIGIIIFLGFVLGYTKYVFDYSE